MQSLIRSSIIGTEIQLPYLRNISMQIKSDLMFDWAVQLTLTIHDTEPLPQLLSGNHGSCTKKSSVTSLFDFVYQRSLHALIYSFFHQNASRCSTFCPLSIHAKKRKMMIITLSNYFSLYLILISSAICLVLLWRVTFIAYTRDHLCQKLEVH